MNKQKHCPLGGPTCAINGWECRYGLTDILVPKHCPLPQLVSVERLIDDDGSEDLIVIAGSAPPAGDAALRTEVKGPYRGRWELWVDGVYLWRDCSKEEMKVLANRLSAFRSPEMHREALQALEDFGQHLGTCAVHKRTPAMIDKGEWRKCDCGFEAAFTTRPKQDTKPEEIDLMKVLVKDLKKREAEPAKVEGSAPPQGEKP